MRPIRALSLGLMTVVLAACAGTVPGWTHRVVKEMYFVTRTEDGATWLRPGPRQRWKLTAPAKTA